MQPVENDHVYTFSYIVLKAHTARGKQILKEFGDKWVVTNERSVVQFAQKVGGWILISPNIENKDEVWRGQRWINRNDDKHFTIVSESTDAKLCNLSVGNTA